MHTLNIDCLAINWYSLTSQQTRSFSKWKDFFCEDSITSSSSPFNLLILLILLLILFLLILLSFLHSNHSPSSCPKRLSGNPILIAPITPRLGDSSLTCLCFYICYGLCFCLCFRFLFVFFSLFLSLTFRVFQTMSPVAIAVIVAKDRQSKKDKQTD